MKTHPLLFLDYDETLLCFGHFYGPILVAWIVSDL